jgi:hypothetical protein
MCRDAKGNQIVDIQNTHLNAKFGTILAWQVGEGDEMVLRDEYGKEVAYKVVDNREYVNPCPSSAWKFRTVKKNTERIEMVPHPEKKGVFVQEVIKHTYYVQEPYVVEIPEGAKRCIYYRKGKNLVRHIVPSNMPVLVKLPENVLDALAASRD